MQCLTCKKETDNPKFCSRSCAAVFNNSKSNGRKTGKRKNNIHCKSCNKLVTIPRRKYCDSCSRSCVKTANGTWILQIKLTKGQLLTNDTQKYRRIRGYARLVALKNGLLDECLACGYSKYVECCHKKPVASFSNSTLISTINDPKNLTGLCKNHHWEFDNGFLTLRKEMPYPG